MKRFPIAFVVIVSTILISCNFIREKLPADGFRNITLKNNTFAMQYWLGSHKDIDDKDSYHLYIKGDSLSNFKRVVTDLFNDEYDLETVQVITFYTDTTFNAQDVVLKPQNISGVQIFYLEDSYLNTKVYKNTNGQLQPIEALHSFVDYFKAEKIVYETSKIFGNATNSNFILANPEAAQKYETGKSNYDKNLADYQLKN
ncbi:hypothetical protein KORDIASMS9_03898 [Kordia sp. SMS9]|uniref:hypothetical protein n=1 Tax=Kordia sp. SMS9 TaxID=2282170 RepID=UPI000E0D67D9|nr:hypothetical protein [Kordia sp. SMS9]AXG71641.1 hypothetical protein KORDIASMS9_03898 [Kordia sp. SMS9]